VNSHPRYEHPKREKIRIAWQFGFFLIYRLPKRIPIQSLAVSEILFIFAAEMTKRRDILSAFISALLLIVGLILTNRKSE
jgi:hypothetical protein